MRDDILTGCVAAGSLSIVERSSSDKHTASNNILELVVTSCVHELTQKLILKRNGSDKIWSVSFH